nr:reverse transcriptase domain-containing protein [Tanacetum cinerariifolium]
ACPHHGFSELHQLDTFYNALNVNDHDSWNSAAGGNFLDKMPRECLKIIESKSKVRQTRSKAVVAKVSTSSSTPSISSEVSELKDMVNQPLAYQAPIPQTQSVSQTNFERYIKANDAVLRNMQSQGQSTQNQCQNVQNQLANLTDMVSKLLNSNIASSSGSGTLPGNTITNPKEDLKGITSRSGAAYQRPPIPTQSKVVKQGTKVTKDQVQTLSSQSTAPVQPLVTQSETQTLVFEPIVALISVPMPNLKPSIPYPSRRNNERRRDQANEQIEKFYEIFKEMSFEISITDALILMPKFASTLKALIGNKEKLSEMARTPMNEYCSAVILNKLPRKLRDPGKFLIPCEFPGMDECLALADLDTNAGGNPTSYDDPIISTTSPTLTPFGDSDFLLFEEADTFLGLEDDPNSPKFDPSCYDPEGDIHLREAILNSEPLSPLPNHDQYLPSFKKELKVCEAKTVKSSVDEPPEVELKDLPSHLKYVFLEGDNKLPIIIAKELRDEDKSALIKDYKPAVQHQRRVNPKIHDVINKEVEKLLDAGLIYPISDSPWVSPVCIDYRKLNEATRKDHFPLPFMDQMLERLAGNEYYCFFDGFSGYFEIPIDPRDQEKKTFTAYMARLPIDARLSVCAMHRARFKGTKMLQRCEDTNLSLNWEKSHFMVKEGIVLGHKISKNEIEVDKAKVDVIAKLPHPTTVKENLAADQLSRLENPYENVLDPKEINETFPLEMLSMVTFRGDSSAPWFADFSNYHAGNFIVKVTHHLSTAYHPQTSGQVEVSNRGLKRILERTIDENRACWSDKLDEALWAFCTAYKTPIRCTPYKLMYEKACHLLIELEHKAHWALKQANFDLAVVGDHRKVQLNELNELRDHAYENSLIYKEKTKIIHESKIKNRVFNVGDRVLLFNSRLKIFSGKLKTRWSGPFTIAKVFPYGTVELSQANGPNFKVNGHRVKHYFGGDVPQLDCPDCEVSLALSFCPSSTRASHPQLHFGNQ